jgi:transcriptional regulator with XRE-family HTH domain
MIRELREKKGWSQSELSRRSGVKQGVLSYIESGRTKHPRSDTLAAIAAALGTTVEKLIRKVG